APEIAQESFLRLCQAELGTVSSDEIRFWLFRVARNLAINEVRRRSTRKRLWDRVSDAVLVSLRGPAEILEQSEAHKRVRQLLDELPEHQRSALLLREQEEMSYREIAVVLAVSESKVKIDIYRGRQRLRSLWNKEELRGH
ncbi:MAG: sigma-70 family RNA polymerase sigma factor, partial [Acidobacteriota bacterium]|nr:sigma-70 family RNA polymerase sigma factor [Acidobacteriota bacterium]